MFFRCQRLFAETSSSTASLVLIDLFFIIEDTDTASYSDGNAPYVSADNIDGVISF